MYDVEVKTPGLPIELKEVASPERVRSAIEHSLAAWGIPIPSLVQEARRDAFAAQLAEEGRYEHHTADCHVLVQRSPERP